jgi:glycosyltransferase involved in cell wall biosynthesis
MTTQTVSLETFAPIRQELVRPVWSVMIPTYNCSNFLRETLNSVLAQDPGPEYMQIEVIDDCSTKDNPEEVVKQVGKGRVSFYRQSRNVGHTRNFDTCIRRAQGRLVHILHGDDRVRSGFYSKMEELFKQHPAIGAAFCRYHFIDEFGQQLNVSQLQETQSGLLSNALVRLAQNQIVQPPSMVVRRAVYETLGGYDPRLKYGEDWEMWVRIASRYQIGYEPEILAEYRKSTSSITGNFSRSGLDISYTIKVIKIISQYIDQERRKSVEMYARRAFGEYHRALAFTFYYKLEDPKAAKAQIEKLVYLYNHPRFLVSLIRLYLRTLIYN